MQIPDILLVEDNPDDAELALDAFRRHGVTLRLARDGIEALEAIFGADDKPPQPLPQLILLDLKMPRLDGFHVLEKLKADPRTRAIPVVMLTASDQEKDLARCYRLGANSYLVKPIDFGNFVNIAGLLTDYWLRLNRGLRNDS